MNPPATIKILHLEFQLCFEGETFFDAAGAFGYCDKRNLRICIYSNQRPALLCDTVIHECLHGIHFAVGCEEELTEEQVARQFAGPLCMLIRDNPKLVEWLQSLLNPEEIDDGAYQ